MLIVDELVVRNTIHVDPYLQRLSWSKSQDLAAFFGLFSMISFFAQIWKIFHQSNDIRAIANLALAEVNTKSGF